MANQYPYDDVHQMLSRSYGEASYSALVGCRGLRRIAERRHLGCSGVELGQSWLAWYEGNIVVDELCRAADSQCAHPWRVTSLIRAGVCNLCGMDSGVLGYVVACSQLLARIRSGYGDGKESGVGGEYVESNDECGVVYLALSDVRYLWDQSKRSGKGARTRHLLSGAGSYKRFVTLLMMLGRAGYVDGVLGGSLGSEQWEESGCLGGSYELLWYLEEDLSGMGMYHCLCEDDWCSRLMCGGASQDSVAEYYDWRCRCDDCQPLCGDQVVWSHRDCTAGGSTVSGPGVVLRLYVSLYCGTQSDREAAESMGYVYVGFNILLGHTLKWVTFV